MTNKKISHVLIKMSYMDNLSIYNNILLYFKYVKNPNIPTMCVHLTPKGIECHYNKDFVNDLTYEELTFILLHECFHILLRHCIRNESMNKQLANIAMDAIVNTTLINTTQFKNYIKPIANSIYIDEKYQGSMLSEEYYLWLLEQYKDDNNLPQLSHYSIKNTDGKIVKGESIGFDIHCENDIDKNEDENKINTILNNIIENFVEKTKGKGILPSNIEKMISSSLAKKQDYLKLIKRTVNNTLLHTKREKTYLRPNRFGIEGLKGNFYKGFEINCILDTSGSMQNVFDKVLSYLYNNKVVVNLIQIDTKIQNINRITNTKHINKIQVKGLGGTILQPAIDYITQHKQLNKFNTLILTDGYTDTLDISKFNKNILVISVGKECNIKSESNKITQIIVENDT